jgi:DNA-binding NarL/FixJ family response regulator
MRAWVIAMRCRAQSELAVAGAVEPVALVLAGAGLERSDAGVAGELGVGLEACDRSDLAEQLARADRAAAGQGEQSRRGRGCALLQLAVELQDGAREAAAAAEELARDPDLRLLLEAGEAAAEPVEPEATVERAKLEHAKARTELGAALRRANRRSQAREQLRQAVELATICGAASLAERAERELLATGARPRRIALSGVDSLTPSERRVAELAATGPTNREIAQALFVTQRTVEVHLTSIYRKLGIGSRSQLPTALARPTPS